MIENLKQKFEEIKELIENQEEDYEDKLYEIEEDVERHIDRLQSHIFKTDSEKTGLAEKELEESEKLAKKIKKLKKENNSYNEEDELDSMFPDRHDADFDEDSMSYDSVFGDD
ncbi:MAG: hypothetical protein GZ087_14985 [Flavobacterium sp.]|nr:hypothetical protein [Flavobacterium sp.]